MFTGILLLREAAHPHNISTSFATTWGLQIQIIHHPAHSRDLAFSDHHLLGLMKVTLEGRTFERDQEIKERGAFEADSTIENTFSDGIKNSMQYCEKFTEKESD